MAPSLLWTDNLARLAQGSGVPPEGGRARFPAGGVAPPRPPPPAALIPPRPHLTPTRVAQPGTPEFAAAQLLARPPAPAPRASQPPRALAPTPAHVPRPAPRGPTPAAAPAPVPARPSAPPMRAAPPPAAPPAVAPVAPVAPVGPARAPTPQKPRSLSDLAAVPSRLAGDLGVAQRAGAPVTTSSAAWQRPTFKSVELRIESLDLEMAALAQQGAPALTPAVAAPAPLPASRPAVPAPPTGIAREAPPVPDEALPASPGAAPPEPGLIEAQLAGFLERAVGDTGAAAAFIADADGLEMANHLATPELLAVSALMGRHASEVRQVLKAESEGALAFELDADNLLQVAWVDTELGRLALGLVVHQAPTAAQLAGLRERLREAARRPTSRRAKPAPARVNESVF